MKSIKKSLVVSSAIAAGLMMGTATDAFAGKKGAEKCYGVSKAGKNDCGIKSLGTSCAGSATKDNISDAFVYLPKGVCDKIAGGSKTAKG